MLDFLSETFWAWVVAALIGIVMGCLSYSVSLAYHQLLYYRQKWTHDHAYFGNGLAKAWAIYSGSSVVVTALGAAVTYWQPLSAGSGIPDMKTYLNGVQVRGLLSLPVLIAKMTGVVFAIAGGLICGKEGPFVHGGGIVGSGISGMGSRTVTEWLRKLGFTKADAKFKGRWASHFRNKKDHRDFTAIGTAAGVAAAFTAPIGGLLFTIEEGVSFYSTSVCWRGFLACCLAVLSNNILSSINAIEHRGTYHEDPQVRRRSPTFGVE
jgi:chloride channel 7